MATTDLHFVADALHPVKKGIRFLGGDVNDGVQVDAAGVAAAAAAYPDGTISAWVMVPDNTGDYCILGFGDASAVEFLSFKVKAGKLECDANDATATAFQITSTDVVINPHQWHHVAVVQNGVRPTLYVDGAAVAMTDTDATDLTTWWDQLSLVDGAHIGVSEEAGDASLTLEFKGYIHKVKHWGSAAGSGGALTAAQVLADFEGGTNTTALVNSWDLEFDLLDDGSGDDAGTAVGAIVFSDANAFASRLTFLETVPLAADNVTITSDNGVGFAYSILAA